MRLKDQGNEAYSSRRSPLFRSKYFRCNLKMGTWRGCAFDTVYCCAAEGKLLAAHQFYAKALEVLDSDQCSAAAGDILVRHVKAAVMANLACVFLRLGLPGTVIQVCAAPASAGTPALTSFGGVAFSVVFFSAAQRSVSRPDMCIRLEAVALRQPPADVRWGPHSFFWGWDMWTGFGY